MANKLDSKKAKLSHSRQENFPVDDFLLNLDVTSACLFCHPFFELCRGSQCSQMESCAQIPSLLIFALAYVLVARAGGADRRPTKVQSNRNHCKKIQFIICNIKTTHLSCAEKKQVGENTVVPDDVK